jgi:outer membrane beta-barrel protein
MEGRRVSRRALLAPAAFLSLCTALAAAPARAEDDLDSGRVIAVEKKPYRMVHEFSFSAGILPLDALYVGYSLGGSYTLHLSDIWAWEIVDFHYSSNVDTGLPVTLAERWSVAPTLNPEFQYTLASHAIFAPLFGKFALFNSHVLFVETYFALGGGITHFSDGFRPELSVGWFGLRLFFGQRVSARLDIRSMFVPDIPSGIDHVMQFSLGVSFNFGSVRATESDTAGDQDDTTGFEELDELYPTSNPARGTNERAAPQPEEKNEQ